MLNTILALLAVLAVMVAHAVYRLVRLPFRLLRGLFRNERKPAPPTARSSSAGMMLSAASRPGQARRR